MNRISALLLAVGGCYVTPDAPCRDGSGLVATLAGLPSTAITADLTLHGTLTRPAEMTVYKLLINGISATSTSENYVTFDVLLPFAQLQGSAATASAPGSVVVMAQATTDCSSVPVPVAVTNDPAITVAPVPLTFLPAAGVIQPGDDVVATVDPHGESVIRCRVFATSGLDVELNGRDALSQPFVPFSQPVSLRINAVAVGSGASISVTVTCEDDLGRVASATWASP